MNYSHEVKDNILFLDFQGDLLGESTGLELMELINEKLNSSIFLGAIDLSQVRYMNSSGIGVMITVLNKFKEKGGEAVLVNPSEQISKLLDIMKLNALFSIVESKEEAIDRLRKIIL